MNEAEIEELGRALKAVFVTPVDPSSRVIGASMCLWVSHWYQQSYAGGPHAWNTSLDEVGARIEPATTRRLVEGGLSYLRREIRRLNGERQYLATVMMEGGFPSRMVVAEAGWLRRYVEAVVIATGQGDQSEQSAYIHAEFYQYLVPPTFRAAHFVELVAELAYRIAALRRRIADAGIAAGAIEWLDRVEPNWREGLPIRTDEEAARRLVEGLVRVRDSEHALPVECRRILIRDVSGAWTLGIRLQIDGEIRDDDLPPLTRQALRGYNRARLRVSGEMAVRGFGAVAVASRSGRMDDLMWDVRSLFGSTSLEVGSFPRHKDVTLHFAAGRDSLPEFVPSGGARVTSDILVFGTEARGTGNKLVMIGSGSVRDMRTQLFAAVPWEARIDVESGSEVQDVGVVEDLRLLAISGMVTVLVDGDSYRIRSGAETVETARLEVVGEKLEPGDSAVPIFRGAPELFVFRGLLRSRADANSVRVRYSGARGAWLPYRPGYLPVGSIEVGLFGNDVCLDRIRLVHVPAQALIKTRVSVPGEGEIHISSFGEVSCELVDEDKHSKLRRTAEGAVIEIAGSEPNLHYVEVRIRWPHSEALIRIPALTRHIAFYDESGKPFSARARSSIPGLTGSRAESVERSSILIGLRSGSYHTKAVEKRLERSLSFSQLREDVERLLSMSDDLDAEVTLEAMWYGKSAAFVSVRRFDIVLEPSRDRSAVFLAAHTSEQPHFRKGAELEVVGRPFREIECPDRKLESMGNGDARRWEIPDGDGPWIAYAKVDGVPRSRPVLVHRTLAEDKPLDGLTRALLERNKSAREAMILTELGRVERGEAPKTCDRITAFMGSLDPALPFQSFDILRALPRALGAAARIAVTCPEAVLPRVLDLENRMPLTWCLSRPESWRKAMGEMGESYRKVFRDVGADEGLADDVIRNRAYALSERQPCLAMHMAWTLSDLRVPIDASAPQALKRSSQLVGREQSLAPYLKKTLKDATIEARARNGERAWPTDFGFRRLAFDLPTTEFEMDASHQAIIDAPCFASRIALGRAERTREAEENIRTARSFDPQYFEDAFVIAITLGRGQATC